MPSIGNARVSSTDQDCAIQEVALRAAGCEFVRSEKRSGTSIKGRDELAIALDFLRSGDTLVVTRIDRLARSVFDLEAIVKAITSKGATLRATEQPIDTSTSAGKAFLQMLGVFAEFETSIRRERQMEGIAKAKLAGVYKGRRKTVDVKEVISLRASGMGPSDIAKTLKIGRASVYRALGANSELVQA